MWAHVCAAPTPAGLERPIRDTPCRRFRRGYPVTAALSADAVPHPLIAAQTASQERGSPPHWTAPLEKERDAPSPHLYSVRSIRSGLLAFVGAYAPHPLSRAGSAVSGLPGISDSAWRCESAPAVPLAACRQLDTRRSGLGRKPFSSLEKISSAPQISIFDGHSRRKALHERGNSIFP